MYSIYRTMGSLFHNLDVTKPEQQEGQRRRIRERGWKDGGRKGWKEVGEEEARSSSRMIRFTPPPSSISPSYECAGHTHLLGKDQTGLCVF